MMKQSQRKGAFSHVSLIQVINQSQMMGRDRAQATAGFIFLVENGGKADKERNLGKLIGRVVKDLTMVL